VPEPHPAEEPAATPEAQARTRALRLLSHRERTRRGLERILAAAGFPRSAIRLALDDLETRGLLSDLRYARLYLSAQARARPRSRSLLRRDLERAGVARETANHALGEGGDDLSEESLARAAARNKLRTAGNDPARLSRLLRARGFAPGVVRRALVELLGSETPWGGGRRRARDDDSGASDDAPATARDGDE
jgi:regulatory protein